MQHLNLRFVFVFIKLINRRCHSEHVGAQLAVPYDAFFLIAAKNLPLQLFLLLSFSCLLLSPHPTPARVPRSLSFPDSFTGNLQPSLLTIPKSACTPASYLLSFVFLHPCTPARLHPIFYSIQFVHRIYLWCGDSRQWTGNTLPETVDWIRIIVVFRLRRRKNERRVK